MTTLDTSFLVVALMACGMGIVILMTDYRSRTSRALSLAMLFIGLRLGLHLFEGADNEPTPVWLALLARVLEALDILFGIEWARRIGQTATVRLRATVNVLFRVSQGFALIYALMTLGYVLLSPENATTSMPGFFRVRALEWAIFTPVLGVSILLSAIAILMLLITRTDPVESVRLRALVLAAPFLLAGLVLEQTMVPIVVAIGLMIFLGGSMRYLIIQGRRGQFMSQFLSPEVARLVRLKGMDHVLKRERRPLSVVICDLRGFTRYARERNSDEVVGALERFYSVVGEVAAQHGGTVKDHAGDGVLILIGAPVRADDHAQRAARLALELRRRVNALLREIGADLGLGIGVATGKMTVGAIQGAGRLEYVAVGTAVNLASRLCQRAEAGEILIDQRTQAALQQQSQMTAAPREREAFKGFDAPVQTYALNAAALQPALAA